MKIDIKHETNYVEKEKNVKKEHRLVKYVGQKVFACDNRSV